MSERTPDIASLIAGHVQRLEGERLARVHEVLLRAGPAPELPDTLARPPAVAAPRPPDARPSL